MTTNLPSYLLDPNAVLKDESSDIKWRGSLPNYDKANQLFQNHKTANHPSGSLEDIVQNLVKNWEKGKSSNRLRKISSEYFLEVSHKIDPRQWLTVDLDNYRFSCNGQQKYSGWEMLKNGTYNALIGQTNYYDSNAISFEDSHTAFKRSLGEGFAWEVLEVCSGPPTVTFTWRHFGRMTDYFSCPGLSGLIYKVDPTNKMVKIYGMCKATVNDQFQIQDLQVFYDPNQLFTQLTEISPFAPFARLHFQGPSLPKPTNQNETVNQLKDKQPSTLCSIL